VVSPDTSNVAAGATKGFAAAGYDLYGNGISGLVFSWTTDVGGMTGSTLTAQTVSGVSGYVRASSGPVSGYASVAITPANPDHIDVSPAELSAVAGSQTQLNAALKDMYNNTISGVAATWTTAVGTVTPGGLFTAQTMAGASGLVVITSGGVMAAIEVTIVPDQLTHIVVTEGDIDVTTGTYQDFTAVGYDQYDNEIPGLTFVWTTNVGTMAGSTLHAQNESGVTGYVRASSGQVSGDAVVTIVSIPSEGLSAATLGAISGVILAVVVALFLLLMFLRRRKVTPT
jgi:hypothetical protein